MKTYEKLYKELEEAIENGTKEEMNKAAAELKKFKIKNIIEEDNKIMKEEDLICCICRLAYSYENLEYTIYIDKNPYWSCPDKKEAIKMFNKALKVFKIGAK